jgi:hypothetical protein
MDELYINIINSNIKLDIFKIGKKKIKIKSKIGKGLHGIIFDINNYIIKIYSKFNIEFDFYRDIIVNKKTVNNLTNECAIGLLFKPFIYDNLIYTKKSYLIIIPKYTPLDKININIKEEKFLINFIKKNIILNNYLYNKYKYVNLDLKLMNIMYDEKIKDIVIIDFSLIIKDNNKLYIPNKINKQWPIVICKLKDLTTYSLYISIIDILNNNKELDYSNLNNISMYLLYHKYSIFFVNLLEKLNNISDSYYILNSINNYENTKINKWFRKLLKFNYELLST